jgi:hypothetical protein
MRTLAAAAVGEDDSVDRKARRNISKAMLLFVCARTEKTSILNFLKFVQSFQQI